jgi:hypothetical protein
MKYIELKLLWHVVKFMKKVRIIYIRKNIYLCAIKINYQPSESGKKEKNMTSTEKRKMYNHNSNSKIQNNKMRYFAIILSLFFMTSCYAQKNTIIVEGEKNPTEYFFNFPMDTVRNVIKKSFNRDQYCGYDIHDFTDPFFKKIKNPNRTDNDFLLSIYWLGSWWRTECRSKVYFNKKGKPYLYFSDFHLHLTETDNGVSVKIYAINPQIHIGYYWWINPHSLARDPKFKEVPNTTVEEYEILLMIGKTLGVNDMPIIKIPNKKVI